MTAKQASDLSKKTEVIIEHTPSNNNTQLTGLLDGKAFYEPISMRSFEALKRHGAIKKHLPFDGQYYGPERWYFTKH